MSFEVQNLNFYYGERQILKDINFSTVKGSILAVIGPNGVGKSTLFGCMLGHKQNYSGSISIDDVEIRTLSPRQRAHKIAYIPQVHSLPSNFTVLDMVLMGTSHNLSPFSVPKEKEYKNAHNAMEQIGIIYLKEKNYLHLSGGEQQLVLIARALAQNTNTLLMDEPTSNLDYGNQTFVLEKVKQLSNDGYTVIFTTHNPQHALWYADYVLALNEGKVVAFGTPDAIITEELIAKIYGIAIRIVNDKGNKIISPILKSVKGVTHV